MDAWAAIEGRRLQWYRNNQHTLRVENQEAAREAMEGGRSVGEIGRVLLPAHHVGGPRYMHDHYRDCMALVHQCGKPSLFITMTTNPNWPEIVRELLPDQTAADRPDIVARVFRLKLQRMWKEIMKGHIFGRAVGGTYVVEYQKRGLPHAHMLIILHRHEIGRAHV